jgi:lipocalin-like protein
MLNMLRRGFTGLLTAATAAVFSQPVGAANMEDKLSLVGTWKVVDAISRDAQGRELAKPFGLKGMGIVTLNADGRMMAVLCDGRAHLPDGTKREYSSYCGNYTFDGTTLITRVDASASPRNAIGSDQVRKVRFEGKRMVLTPPPTELNGVMQYRDIFWERISTESA